jgi:drug/metabolite transporter (DMT)-like permease
VPETPRDRRPGTGDLALAGAALCFGGTFIVVQDAIEQVEPIPFLAVRFAIGAAVLWAFALRRPSTPGLVRDGGVVGISLLAGYVLQTIGLQYTDSATSAFITYLLVVFVPLLGLVVLRRRPHRVVLLATVVAMGGLALLTGVGGDGAGLGKGEVLTVGCAVAFGAQVVLLGETARRHDPLRLAAVQVSVVALACAGPGLVFGGYRFTWAALLAAAATAVIATAGGFGLQVAGQRTVPPNRAALLLLLEPVFAAVLAAIDDDPLGGLQLLGAAVILAAIALSELGPQLLDRRVAVGQAVPDNDRS